MLEVVENGTSNGTIPIRKRIQARLDELNQTPAWLAEKAGVPRSTITRILRGERNPTPETLHEIAPVLGVEV
jgi:transcriptional regulator with XRE-family HTH domain